MTFTHSPKRLSYVVSPCLTTPPHLLYLLSLLLSWLQPHRPLFSFWNMPDHSYLRTFAFAILSPGMLFPRYHMAGSFPSFRSQLICHIYREVFLSTVLKAVHRAQPRFVTQPSFSIRNYPPLFVTSFIVKAKIINILGFLGHTVPQLLSFFV